jgi:Zn-dependent peptidase ImmA (M78 family)
MPAGPDTAKTIRHGDLASFACQVRFYPEPDAAVEVDPELALSWGELSLWVRGRNLCAHWMHGDSHPGVHWYLLSFLEWLAENWDPLLHEERMPYPDSGAGAAIDILSASVPVAATVEEAIERFSLQQQWTSRHGLRAAADGGLFPNVFLRRRRGQIEVSWHNGEPAFAPDDFVYSDRSGYETIRASAVADTLYSVLRHATEHLAAVAANSPRLHDLASVVSSLPDPSRTNQRVSWLAGLGRTADEALQRWSTAREAALAASTQGTADAIDAALGTHASPLLVDGTCRAAVLFGSMSPAIAEPDVRLIARLLLNAYDPSRHHPELDDISQQVDADYEHAWRDGYELAERVHDELAFDTTTPIDVVGTIQRLKIRRKSVELCDCDIRGLSLTSPVHRATIVVNSRFANNRREEVLRFTLAHELCHVLFDQDFEHELAMASGPWAPAAIERRANAFAAMFLMPRDLVRHAIAHANEPPDTLNGVIQLARRMETSISTTIEHLHNLNQIDGFSRDRLREELGFGYG